MIDENGFLVAKDERKVNKNFDIDYLMSLLQPVEFMTDQELQAMPTGSVFVFDVECYENFFYVAFKSLDNGKCVAFEMSPDSTINTTKFLWMMWRFCIVGFNSRGYDLPIIALMLKGASTLELKEGTRFIIEYGNTPFTFAKTYGVTLQEYNHIDLIEVAPLQGSLKLYGGRIHCKVMQDLPFDPNKILTQKEAELIKLYCCNDLDNTELLFNELAAEIQLRVEMSQEYGVDLRSKSDAQIAEAVISSELEKVLGYYPRRPKITEDSVLQYNIPDFIEFDSPQLQGMLGTIRTTVFYLDGGGSPIMPDELGKMKVRIGNSVYKLGMGGLHSQEKTVAHKADENTILADNDVASYYPRIILNQGLAPSHLGESFLQVYNSIVERRLYAKQNGLKTENATLKIVINGSFGKMGNKYSALYSPQLMLQVTITGQLCLLMLIEMLEAAGISVVSANTDGIVSLYDKSRHEEVRDIISLWESITNFETEETQYSALYSRDVNNYMAVKMDNSVKKKGTYAQGGLSKSPEHNICTDAVIAYLTEGKDIEQTIRGCQDITKFLSIKNVRGGGEKDGKYLGKVVRWYYAKGEQGYISYVSSGNKVAKSDGAKPLMILPDELPTDIDYDWYINTANEMLFECGAIRKPEVQFLF